MPYSQKTTLSHHNYDQLTDFIRRFFLDFQLPFYPQNSRLATTNNLTLYDQ